MFDIINNTTVNNNSTPRDEAEERRRFLYQRAIEAYQFHVNRYHTWMNYYSIFTGALFVGFCSLTTATTKIIKSSSSTLNHCCSVEDGKILYTLSNNYTLLIIAICLLGFISSICWLMSLCGHEKWEHNWMKNIEYYEDNNDDKNIKYNSFVLYKINYGKDFKAISTHVITKIFIIFVIFGWFFCLGKTSYEYCSNLCYCILSIIVLSIIVILIMYKNNKTRLLLSDVTDKIPRT